MRTHIRSIETAVPGTLLRQSEIRDLFANQPGITRLGSRLIGAAFDASGITSRATVVDELDCRKHEGVSIFYDAATQRVLDPGTAARNAVYTACAPELFTTAARLALDAASLTAAEVTHVVTVSCTGFYAPGPDYQLVRHLGLAHSTQRLHVGFMGCYGAFPALRAARQFCEADHEAVVLVVAVELCTIHLTSSNDPEQIVATSVFADGGAAAVVTAREPVPGTPVLEFDALTSTLIDEGENDMAWTIGDHGFTMRLSTYVPSLIGVNIGGALDQLLATTSLGVGDIARWAIHPGGRSILDKVQVALGLDDEQLHPSREVLRNHGNMSSATILFILRNLLRGAARDGERIGAMAFGPGLTVELALLTQRGER
ncbi:type III polyketide synthase [Rathayibacter toxicus]|uniref:Naringenin-chalcone synthase n=1 Tax=Rathayibacter toxicus TaxID=145458 RepID=A0A0C5B7Q7_9MICO|nr:3-oxoacyl-[acyl-carrier-protein] synthase III C-terminal domain-containing protein [Rathayibacter toxicus]AJM76808.1 naringenin-chalcone synthase [Rathayibacter toxicus]ALS57432.1 naringenin-chalcone synthase [Rathayibacter toxicus]KKM44459.1 naringenin-chalcone synthase [Rathayibacter toxicus]PPG20903.1 type III polyketide synthase [Rathayibacter toxicus]PPG46007.1 type III polyketide synthase [Rathayibacter toxicus]